MKIKVTARSKWRQMAANYNERCEKVKHLDTFDIKHFDPFYQNV